MDTAEYINYSPRHHRKLSRTLSSLYPYVYNVYTWEVWMCWPFVAGRQVGILPDPIRAGWREEKQKQNMENKSLGYYLRINKIFVCRKNPVVCVNNQNNCIAAGQNKAAWFLISSLLGFYGKGCGQRLRRPRRVAAGCSTHIFIPFVWSHNYYIWYVVKRPHHVTIVDA